MLRLISGAAGSGKTGLLIDEIRESVNKHQGKRLLIVPEQYSHEAERELCSVCGDTLSLYAEVMSFTGFSRRIMSRGGGAAVKLLDKGGRLLCMALALTAVHSRLEVYSSARHRVELQAMLLDALDEVKNACISAEQLQETAALCPGELGRKLRDLALIMESFEAIANNGHADTSDRLNILAEQLPESGIGAEDHIYIDGFIDFTVQQQRVIETLLRCGANVTVCLTLDDCEGGNEIFELSRRAARKLKAAARECGAEFTELRIDSGTAKCGQLRAYCENMFSYSALRLEDEGRIELFSCDDMNGECEFAAARALSLVRDCGCRWRDIAIAVRGFDDYASSLESAFRHYGVPLFIARRSDIMEKPLPALISSAYEIINGGWDSDEVVSYLRTGLTGLKRDECDELSNYIFKWQLKAGAWLREDDWRQHPDGYNCEFTPDTAARLERINSLRRALAHPLLVLKEKGSQATTAQGQAEALCAYFEALALPDILKKRADELLAGDRAALSAEYSQLWALTVAALEQCSELLGDSESDFESFGALFCMMLSKYDVSTIPVALDRVSAGDFDRMRRRSIKHLIVLGAADTRLPKSDAEVGIFTDEDRQRLAERELELGGAGEAELWREFTLIYNTLTLPAETLTMTYPLIDGDGNTLRPAFIFNRAAALFSLNIQRSELSDCRMQAPAPALTVAAQALHGGTERERTAAEYFRRREPSRFERLKDAASLTRGRLSGAAVERLYGQRLRLSASRIDKFASCRFAYFCQYGLRAKPYEPALFTPPEIGSFYHYILENVAREVRAKGGFAKVDNKELLRLTERYVQEYIRDELNDFNEKTARFRYLFTRLARDVQQVVTDMAEELRRSDFEPMAFEFDFSRASSIPPVELGEGENSLTLTGIADRIDGWRHDGRLYLRVVDYKTGRKSFELSEIYYGKGLQLLLYLFALERNGEAVFNEHIIPAGVMYVPARNDITNLSSDLSDDECEKERLKKIKRSGIVLDDAGLIEAWEKGEEKLYIPIKLRARSESLASLERFEQLSAHIRKTLTAMAKELRCGSISADPYYRSQQENACTACDYFSACHFSNGENGESFRCQPKLGAETVWQLIEGGSESDE